MTLINPSTSQVVDHIVVQRAAKMRRRTYRAHGRINRQLYHESLFQL